MSESTRTSRAPADKRLTYQQWKRRKMLRLARNWVLFLAGCAAVVALLTGGILWLLPKVHSLLAGPKVFAASVYDGTDYVFNRNMKFFGRQNEIKELQEIRNLSLQTARFTIVTGRRRSGKTSLLDRKSVV